MFRKGACSLTYLFSVKMLGMSGRTSGVYGRPASSAGSGAPPVFGTPSTVQLAAIIAAAPEGSAAAEAAAVSAALAASLYCPAPACDTTEQTNLLLTLLDSIYSTVDQFFPLITIVAKQAAGANATTFIKPRAFARVYWAQQHKGVKFGGTPVDPATLQIHLLQLKYIYLLLDLDLSLEPLFKLLAPPATSEPSSSEPSTSAPSTSTNP